MNTIKKKIIIIPLMIMGILILGMSIVKAYNGIPSKGSQLKKDVIYDLDWTDYTGRSNLHCAEPGDALSGRYTEKYRYIAHVHIEGKTAQLVNLTTKEARSKTAVTAKYNLRMATAIATLNEKKVGHFLWGYLKGWIANLNEAKPKYYHVIEGFAKKDTTDRKNPNYDEILELVNKRMEKFESGTEDKAEMQLNEDKVYFKEIEMNGKKYTRVGPYTLSGIPSEGLKDIVIKDQDNEEIDSAKLVRYREKEPTAIGVSGIDEDKNFYICIPKDKGITAFSVKIKSKKDKSEIPVADLYFLKCTSNKSWQNLVLTEGDTKPGKGENLTADISKTPLSGDLTIIKQDAEDQEQKLKGATFVIFRYVENKNGSWYKKKGEDTYTQSKSEAEDTGTTYKREYVSQEHPYYTYVETNESISYDTIKDNPDYQFTTGSDGKISIRDLEKATYYAKEVTAPEGYKKIDNFFQLGEVNAKKSLEKIVPNTANTTNVDVMKVNEDNREVAIEGVRFKFYSQNKKKWLKKTGDNKYEYTTNENDATWFATDSTGKIHLEGVAVGDWIYYEDPKSLPYGYDITGKEKGTFKLQSKDLNTVTITNKQKYIKISGFVWVDKVGVKSGDALDRNDLFRTDSNGDHPDNEDLLFDGITVKLKDRTTGNTVQETKTNKLGIYKDAGHNGHGEYQFADVLIEKLGDYYIEFEYDGLNYTNVVPHIDQSSGSKAAENANTREAFNKEFSVIEGNGNGDTQRNTGVRIDANGNRKQDLSYTIKEHKAELNTDGDCPELEDNESNKYINQNKIGNYPITANTNETTYSIKNNFKYGETEVKYINLGLKDRDQPDITLRKDMNNVKISVNGYEHTYQYSQRNKKLEYDKDKNMFNVGVKFENSFNGTYTRAIYSSDWTDDLDKTNELKVYVTYEIAMAQANVNLKAQVNSIVDYYDGEYTLEKAGRKIDNNGNITENIAVPEDSKRLEAENGYAKAIIPCNTVLEPQTDTSIYVRFKLSKEQVATLLGGKAVGEKADKLLYNVAEVNSYSIFSKADNKVYAGIDLNSNPGNTVPGKVDTYENDTEGSPALQLEVADARKMTGKVFIDNPTVEAGQNSDGVMSGKRRQGNGTYDEGEANVSDVTVTLRENSGSGKVYTAKTKNGDFEITDYIPGKYTLTYTWGGQEFEYKLSNGATEKRTVTVQDYKGTVYPEPARQNHTEYNDNDSWWHATIDEKGNKTKILPRYTDAIDNYDERKAIDAQVLTIDKDTKATIEGAYKSGGDANIITKMNSTTPTMGIGVEYGTAYTASAGDRYEYTIQDIDFGIIERAKQELTLTKRVKKMKVTLGNGQVIADLEVGEDGKIKGDHNGITYMKPSANTSPNNGFIRLELDSELIQDTLLEVTYEIKATNTSELDYIPKGTSEAVFYKYGTIDDTQELITMKPIGIIDYLDKSWSFDTEKAGIWTLKKAVNPNEIQDLVVKEVYEGDETKIGEKMILYTEALANESIAPGSAKSVDLSVSKKLTTTDEISLNNEAEEVKVVKTGGSTLETTPGNYIPGKASVEADDTMAETTIVTPATGENQNYIIPIIVVTTALIILGVGVVVIKKKVI